MDLNPALINNNDTPAAGFTPIGGISLADFGYFADGLEHLSMAQDMFAPRSGYTQRDNRRRFLAARKVAARRIKQRARRTAQQMARRLS